jgi:ParB family transcriptional regulator, chromosome partitioning protein
MAGKHGLGRGLSALLTPNESTPGVVAESAVMNLPVEAITPNANQPRKDFEISSLESLSHSIKTTGLLQPVVVRRAASGYELIAGERRWRAAKMAGLETIPAVVREATHAESVELALVENLLREDLNPIEEAQAYQQLLAEFGWTQDELAQRVGRDRSSVANSLRLLRLPELIQADLRAGRLTMGHARALLSLASEAEQLRLRDRILEQALSVRATEEGVSRAHPPRSAKARRRAPELVAIEDSLREALATRVRVVGTERRGRIEIGYTSPEDLERLLERIHGGK